MLSALVAGRDAPAALGWVRPEIRCKDKVAPARRRAAAGACVNLVLATAAPVWIQTGEQLQVKAGGISAGQARKRAQRRLPCKRPAPLAVCLVNVRTSRVYEAVWRY